MVPANPAKGSQVPVPATLCERMFRWHLDPATGVSEGRNFADTRTGTGQLRLVVESVSDDSIRLRLEGAAKLENARRTLPVSYEPALLGYLTFDRARKSFTRFDLLALGEVKGSPGGENRQGERIGTHLLGIAFELAGDGASPPPRGARDNPDRYLAPKLAKAP